MIDHILISRVDAIGDVILTLPLLKIIKQDNPNIKISFLGRNYTQDILRRCQWVDKFINFDDWEKLTEQELISKIKRERYDQVLHVFPHKFIANICFKAKIPVRTGTISRPFHWLSCNNLVRLSRKNSPLHEAQLNIDLWRKSSKNPLPLPSLSELNASYGFRCEPYWPPALTKSDLKKVILHPGSRGSARNWPIKNYVQLCELLLVQDYSIYLTGTQQEGDEFSPYFSHLQDKNFFNLTGQFSLAQLTEFINSCDAVVACSTGPLHIAAALGKMAVGLYVPLRPVHPGRWAAIGENAKILCSTKNCTNCSLASEKFCRCIEEITPKMAFEAISNAQEPNN